ncbi:hypothetical protein, partial [Ruminococcus callidus]|uniref:hypothetical protein n=1 Tax=Ruminococcus callidus TaxID=40519 RepID=UPI003FD8E0C7
FTEKKKRSKKRKEFAFPLYYAATHHPKIIQKIFTNQTPPAGRTGGLSAVTLPFLQLKLGGKVSGDSPQSPGGANRRLVRRNTTLFTVEIGA